MTTLTGADLVAKALADLGVRHVFAIVSIHNMPLLDAINRLGKTAIVDVRHEGAGTLMADINNGSFPESVNGIEQRHVVNAYNGEHMAYAQIS